MATMCDRPDECAADGRCQDDVAHDHAAWPEWDTSQYFDWCGTCGNGVRNAPTGWTHE